MMKKWIAVLAVLCIVLGMSGCAATDVTPATPEDTAVSEEAVKEPLTQLTATVRVYNSEEINTFIQTVTAMQPATYTNTRTVNGEKTTYTVIYEGSETLEARVVTKTAETEYEQTGTLFLSPYYAFFPDATGMNLDAVSYMAALDELGLTKVFEQKSMQTLYGVYAFGFVDLLGQPNIVDFWLNEQEVMQIEFMQMLQGGGMVLQ